MKRGIMYQCGLILLVLFQFINAQDKAKTNGARIEGDINNETCVFTYRFVSAENKLIDSMVYVCGVTKNHRYELPENKQYLIHLIDTTVLVNDSSRWYVKLSLIDPSTKIQWFKLFPVYLKLKMIDEGVTVPHFLSISRDSKYIFFMTNTPKPQYDVIDSNYYTEVHVFNTKGDELINKRFVNIGFEGNSSDIEYTRNNKFALINMYGIDRCAIDINKKIQTGFVFLIDLNTMKNKLFQQGSDVPNKEWGTCIQFSPTDEVIIVYSGKKIKQSDTTFTTDVKNTKSIEKKYKSFESLVKDIETFYSEENIKCKN